MKKFLTTIVFFAFTLGMHAQKFDFEYKQIQVADPNNLTIQEMKCFIDSANIALAQILRVIRNPHTPHEDRLKAFDVYEKLEYDRDDMVLRLEAVQKGTTCILPTDTFGITMTVEQMQAFIEKADKEIKKLEKRGVSPEISTKEREKVYNEYKQLRRFRYVIQKRLDKLNRKRPQ